MNTTPTNGPTDIELYLRDTAVPTPYTLRERLIDYCAGWADRRHLSTAQAQPRTNDIAEAVLLTPWAVARRNEYRASKDLETITHNRIVDPLCTEKAILQARIPLLKEAIGVAQGKADAAAHAARESAAVPPAAAVPRGPGEQHADPIALAARRQREKDARDAATAASAQAAAAASQTARTAHDNALERLAQIGERLVLAQAVLDDRVAECRRYISRRINVYARAITRQHPDAPVIAELTEHLNLDKDAARPTESKTGGAQSGGTTVPGSQHGQGRPAWLSVVDPEPGAEPV
ncbi:hypothetical protein [Pseudarthrobacter sp. B4EP4b]|uniref:hypothetical protein n=1 Tax=Pseudarthrobacter sp. B4EP4b TaxID=2590664 RepID=UPI001154071A|nr:hypothetical protein [Pseudarthrobacter sp. B4EP4b]